MTPRSMGVVRCDNLSTKVWEGADSDIAPAVAMMMHLVSLVKLETLERKMLRLRKFGSDSKKGI